MLPSFDSRLLAWHEDYGRKNLPWQQNPNAYRVWLSEIMLQQTQVTTAIPYFERFTQQLPSVDALAGAPLDLVLHLWSGLGYYARARNLHKTAQIITQEWGGKFPNTLEQLISLPGIGRSTAGAILSLALGSRGVILDGNVKRIISRHRAIEGWPGHSAVQRLLWDSADALTPGEGFAPYTQAMMDLGATICTPKKPQCASCPVAADCCAFRDGTQNIYPEKKLKKPLPIKEVLWFICFSPEGEVLLEKRPPTGLWGGLWTFPEFATKDELSRHCQSFGLHITSRTALAPRRHSFSHYHLDFTPVLIQAQPTPGVKEADRWQWFPPDNMTDIGTPTPAKKLLAELSQNGGVAAAPLHK